MSIARRILLASVVLSLLVSAAFVTLILAITALRQANEREARASDVTTRRCGWRSSSSTSRRGCAASC